MFSYARFDGNTTNLFGRPMLADLNNNNNNQNNRRNMHIRSWYYYFTIFAYIVLMILVIWLFFLMGKLIRSSDYAFRRHKPVIYDSKWKAIAYKSSYDTDAAIIYSYREQFCRAINPTDDFKVLLIARAAIRLKSIAVNIDIQSSNTILSTSILNIDKRTGQLRLTYLDVTKRLEDEDEQLVSSRKAKWKQVAEQRSRLQHLALDYQQEQERLIEENRLLEKLYSESLEEKPRIQTEDEHTLLDTTEQNLRSKKHYDQLNQDNH